jgi:hypothetical protein
MRRDHRTAADQSAKGKLDEQGAGRNVSGLQSGADP